jgi:integrase
MQMNISQVTRPMIEKHLDELNVAGRTRRNHLRIITSLFKFAIRKDYLAKDAIDEVEKIDKPAAEITEIEIFSPNEMKEILAAARPEMVSWLAIAAFAGLRNAELQRLDWADVDLEQGHIEVTAAKAKTGSRRLVPITENLMQWLAPYVQKEGRITNFENVSKQIVWLTEDVNETRKQQYEAAGQEFKAESKFKWKRNALRHSFVSYRLAAIKDTAQVALEAGNSPAMVFNHYRQLVTDKEAGYWFSIVPKEPVKPLILLAETTISPKPATASRIVLKTEAIRNIIN